MRMQGVASSQLGVPQGVGVCYGVAAEKHVVLCVIAVTELVVFHGVLGVQGGQAYLVAVLEEIAEAQQSGQVKTVFVSVVGELVHVLALCIDVGDVGVVDVLAAGGYGGGGQEAELVSVPETEGASSGYRAGDVGQGHRLADVERGAEGVVVHDVLAEVWQAHFADIAGQVVVMEQPSVAVRAVGVGKCGADGSVEAQGDGQEAVLDVLLGGNVDMRSGVVGEAGRCVDLGHGDVLEHRTGEDIQGDELVVRVRGGYRQSVEGSKAVAVAESADEELAGTVERYAAHGLHGLGHVGEALRRYLSRTYVLNGLGRYLAVVDQGTDGLGVLAGHDHCGFQCLRLECHVEVQGELIALSQFDDLGLEVVVTYKIEAQDTLDSFRYLEDVAPVGLGLRAGHIRGRVIHNPLEHDYYACERLSGLTVADHALDSLCQCRRTVE